MLLCQESYHGKGPHDGIGSVCKRAVWRHILQGRAVVKVAQSCVSGIQLFYLSMAEMNERAEFV